MPPTHWVPPPHAIPQAPQFWLSVVRTTQLVPQSVEPDGHVAVQVPALQTSPAAQAFPQLPQSAALVWRFTHWPLQDVVPTGHVHCPVTQDDPPVHAMPHPPQLALSVAGSTQLEPQRS